MDLAFWKSYFYLIFVFFLPVIKDFSTLQSKINQLSLPQNISLSTKNDVIEIYGSSVRFRIPTDIQRWGLSLQFHPKPQYSWVFPRLIVT